MDTKQLLILGGAGAVLFYFLTRPKLKVIGVDKLSQTVTVAYKKLQYTFKTTDQMMEFMSGIGDGITFVTNGNVVDVYAYNPTGKMVDYKQITI